MPPELSFEEFMKVMRKKLTYLQGFADGLTTAGTSGKLLSQWVQSAQSLCNSMDGKTTLTALMGESEKEEGDGTQ